MSNPRFQIAGTTHEVTIQSANITAQGNAESPCLLIPISIAFTSNRSGISNNSEYFVVQNLSAELFLTNKSFRVSQHFIQTVWPVHSTGAYLCTFRFPLTIHTLFYIEKHRQEDLPVSMLINIQVALQEDLPDAKSGGHPRPVVRGFEYTQAHLTFSIEHSQWVNKILPNLGYNAGALVEIPPISILLPKEYAVAIKELEQANRYFIGNDYDKAVAHCRAAIEPIEKQFSNIRGEFPSKKEFLWLKKHFSATYVYIEAILGSDYTRSNKSHHPPSFDNFGRNEATMIVGTTIQLISYFGKIIPENLPED
jgi:hypothetical protein